MRTRFDDFGKHMIRAALASRGLVETDAEVFAEPRRIDVWFVPRSPSEHRPDPLGLLGRMTPGPTTIELFHCTPGAGELASCVTKHGEFCHSLSLRSTSSSTPIQWVISSGRPDTAITGLWLRPMLGWPPGLYEGPPLLWTRLVVVSELPVQRDTLLLRLLGARRVLRGAISELQALEAEAPERMLALPLLVRLRLEVPLDPTMRTTEDQEFLMDTQDIVENWRREAIREGVGQGLIELYEARFGSIPKDLQAIIEGTSDEATLRAWVRLASTRSADEIAEVIRTARAS